MEVNQLENAIGFTCYAMAFSMFILLIEIWR